MTPTVGTPEHLAEQHRAHLSRLFDGYPLPELRDRRLFVTGCTGFVGYWLLNALEVLNRRGHRLAVTALTRDPARFRRRHPALGATPWLELVAGDVRDYARPAGDFDLVVHGAADQQPQGGVIDVVSTIATGTQRVLEHALDAGATRLLLLSSKDVYGPQPASLPRIPEDVAIGFDSLGDRQAPGEARRLAETLSFAYAREFGLELVVARGFFFCGHGMPRNMALYQLIGQALHHRELLLLSDGRGLRGYLYGADVAVWLLSLLVRGRSSTAYNVGSDEVFPMVELARKVSDQLAPGKSVSALAVADTILHEWSVPDLARVRTELGLDVWTPLAESIRLLAHGEGVSR